MLWVVWRQHRSQLIAAFAVLTVAAMLMIPTGIAFNGAFVDAGLASCTAADPACTQAASAFLDRYAGLQIVIPLLLLVPALIGLFWGAPLIAREIEQGTHRFAWRQSVPRSRWLATKVLTLGGAAAGLAAMLSLLVGWWSRPFVEAADNRFATGLFDLSGIVVVAYVLFAFAAGAAVGAVVRKTLPAMGVTLLVFGAVRAAVALWMRPRLAAAKTIAYPMAGENPRWGKGDWTISTVTADGSGAIIDQGVTINYGKLVGRCPDLPAPNSGVLPHEGIQACIDRIGLHVQEVYQPAERFWTFQLIEAALFLGLAAACVGLTAWIVTRRAA